MNGKVERMAVIGAGIMGAGLAQHFAQNGYPVTLYDINGEALEKGLKRARNNLGVKTGKGFYDYEGTSEEEILRRRDYRLMLLLDAYRKGRGPATT